MNSQATSNEPNQEQHLRDKLSRMTVRQKELVLGHVDAMLEEESEADAPDGRPAIAIVKTLIQETGSIIDLAYQAADETERHHQVLAAMRSPTRMVNSAIAVVESEEGFTLTMKMLHLKSLLRTMTLLSEQEDLGGPSEGHNVPGLVGLARQLIDDLWNDLQHC